MQPTSIDVLQLNLGRLCNQTCRHCHVDAGPDRTEVMSRKTAEQCVEALRQTEIPTVDITGGAPELHPDSAYNLDVRYITENFAVSTDTLITLVETGTEECMNWQNVELIDRFGLTSRSLVVEPASNDGYMLSNFVEQGIDVLGVDPAPKQAAKATEIGVPTINDFFGLGVADQLCKEERRADLLIANNVVAHVANPNEFVENQSYLRQY